MLSNFLLPGYFSSNHETIGSSIPIVEVYAAKINKMKNNMPIRWPQGMLPKAIGSVTKIRPGPSPGLRLFAKTIGKIANPASKAIIVSPTHTTIADCLIE